MRTSLYLVVLCLFLTQAAFALLRDPDAIPFDGARVPGKFIVEFNGQQSIGGKQTRDPDNEGYTRQLADNLVAYIAQSTDFNAQAFMHYSKPNVFVGAAIHLEAKEGKPDPFEGKTSLGRGTHIDGKILNHLRRAPNVRQVWPSRYVALTRPVENEYPRTRRSASRTAGAMIDRRIDNDAFPVARQTSNNASNTKFATIPAHVATGVSIQHDRGNFGAGVKACVVDEAIDYSHPALNSGKPAGTACVGPDCQVEGGYDWYGPSTKGDDFLPAALTLDGVRQHPLECSHGSHVAGLIGSNDPSYPGSAPSARLRSYAIFPCLDQLQEPLSHQVDSNILQAFLKAGDDGCDVINASLGGRAWTNDPLAIAASRLSAEGNTFVVAAGNAGRGGFATMDCPGCGENVITVGASVDEIIPGITFTFNTPWKDGTKELFAYSSTLWTYKNAISNLDFYFLANASDPDTPSNICGPLDPSLKLNNTILVVGNGECQQGEEVESNALNATYVLYTLSNYKEIEIVNQDDSDPKVAGLQLAEVQKLYKEWKQNRKLSASVNVKDPLHFATIPNPHAEEATYFSSVGPTQDGFLKPDVLAPGSKIVSSFPLPILWANIAGTSMATPVTTGALALLKTAKGLTTPLDTIRKRLVQSARPIKRTATGDSKLQSVYVQGGGILNVTAAIELTTLTEPYHLSWGDTASRKDGNKRTITVTNVGDATQKYTLSSVAAQSVLALRAQAIRGPNDQTVSPFSREPDVDDAVADLSFQPAQFSLKGGASQKVEVTVHPPQDNPRLLAFSGFVKLQSSVPQGVATVPYAGFAGSFRDVQTLSLVVDSKEKSQLPGLYNLTTDAFFPKDGVTVDLSSNTSDIELRYALATPSEAVICDLVPANISYSATIPFDINASTQPRQAKSSLKFADVPVALRIYNSTYEPRSFNGEDLGCLGTNLGANSLTGEDATLQPGDYRFLIRAHRWTQDDYDLDSSWASYLSHAFKYVKN